MGKNLWKPHCTNVNSVIEVVVKTRRKDIFKKFIGYYKGKDKRKNAIKISTELKGKTILPIPIEGIEYIKVVRFGR